MDIRKTEEFKAKQQKILEERKAEEISAMNIMKNIRRTEELRRVLYEDSQLGHQGPMIFSGIFGAAIALITVTPKFSEYFPKAARFLHKSFAARLLIVFFFVRTGLFLEQNYFENKIKKKEYLDYISAYHYTNELIERRIEGINYAERLYLLTRIDLRKFFNKEE